MPRQPTGRITIEDVASRAGVSVATVSRALRGMGSVAAATRDRVLAAASDLGYRVDRAAASLASGRTFAVAVVAPSRPGLHDATVAGIQSVVAQTRHDLVHVVASSGGSVARRVDAVLDRVDGAVVVDQPAGSSDESGLSRWPGPVVSVGSGLVGRASLVLDHRAVIADAIEVTTSAGHRDPLVLFEPESFAPLDGDRPEVLVPAGRPTPSVTVVDPTAAAVGQALTVGDGRPTALVCTSERLAAAVAGWATRSGVRIPADLSVVSLSSGSLAEACGLTSVHVDLAGAGRAASLTLLELLGDIDPSTPETEPLWRDIDHDLVDRGSVVAAP